MSTAMRPTVDSYIRAQLREVQPKLRQMRAAIKVAAPKAEEKISYGMPYYAYKGRLAYFRLAKAHIGFYVMHPAVTENAKALAKYSTTRVTVRFPLSKPLPITLVKKLIRSRVKFVDAQS